METEERKKQNFEIRKLFIGGIITLLIGIIGTGIWKYIEWNKKEKLMQFMLTTNPLDGTNSKTFNVVIYSDMSGEATQGDLKYEIEDFNFQKNFSLKFTLVSGDDHVDLNGYLHKEKQIYTGIVLGNNNIDGYIIENWDTDLKDK